ncbi:hypothetical protein HanIR_Chr07g0326631 [Helianthus annuus]|nr:hypothetical protein HanIR_Chr07g0326631 [Helianthus annuus]
MILYLKLFNVIPCFTAALKFMFHSDSFLHVLKESESNRIYSNSIRIFNRIRIKYELGFYSNTNSNRIG